MKTKITALALIAVTALSLAPKPAQASDKTLAVLGGFLGGLIIASELNHNHGYTTAPTVVVSDRCDDRGDRYDDRDHSGYWTEVNVRVWVDARWIVDGCDRRGREYRRYVGGHYEYRTDRVWVALDHRGRYDRDDRHDREVGYGYGHRR